jgi:glycosyltransferase involved in cell wall biosynthesis
MRKTLYSSHDEFDQKQALECERIANIYADARINVTQGLADYVLEKYPSSGLALTFNNYVPKDLIPDDLLPKLSKTDGETHLIYEGTIDVTRSGGHYDLFNIFEQIAAQKIHIHLYTTRNVPDYVELAKNNKYIHFHGNMPTKELLKEISQYDFGWAGFNTEKNKTHLDVVLANKVMEYISAGLPVISLDHKTQRNFINETGLGIVIGEIANLKSAIDNFNQDKLKKLVLSNRYNYTIEKNIQTVIDFYNEVIIGFNNDLKNEENSYSVFQEQIINTPMSLVEIL